MTPARRVAALCVLLMPLATSVFSAPPTPSQPTMPSPVSGAQKSVDVVLLAQSAALAGSVRLKLPARMAVVGT